MTFEQKVVVDGIVYPVLLSDEEETLSAAKAAGRVSVAILREGQTEMISGAEYAVELPEEIPEEILIPYLERVVRRQFHLPWNICETERLAIREFSIEDAGKILKEPEDTQADAVFYTPELLASYIRNQYRFYEYGIWAVVRKADGVIVGTAGLTQWEPQEGLPEGMGEAREWGECLDFSLELGYHIFRPYRRRGYAEEACRAILAWAKAEYGCPVWAKVKPDNTGSVRLLEKLEIPYWKI